MSPSLDSDIASDLPVATNLLSDLSNSASNVTKTLKFLREKIENENLQTEQGISLLELKNQMFMSYIANLSYTSLLKLSGISLENNFSIDNLVELRVALERIRPLEDKLKHQIHRYLKLANEGVSEEGAQSQDTKNSLDNIDSSDDDGEATTEDKKDEKQLYKIPRISQTHYPGEEEMETNKQKRERMRALNSSMLRDALEEHTEDPQVHHNIDTLKHKAVEKRREIERYEEENFTRIPLTKQQKAALHQMSTQGTIASDLLSFRNLKEFGGHSEGGKKRKKSKGKGKKGFKKRKKN
ncbi:Neuroguidin [Armadillidium nasatum]|uniref:Neuroguidin n=1 Tax=Armadillidium nasatum TaxID=96803 RepID=A0A5N5SKD1_9CRUS|nr:Neuroguidin [Armadillidium nasatum]